MAKEKAYAVIGLGSFGRELCETIGEKGGRVVAIDQDPVLVEKVKDIATESVLINSTDEDAMAQIAWEGVAVAVVAIGDNVEASIITTAILKRIGIPRIIARAVTEIHQRVLKQVGADEVINIEIDAGVRLGRRLVAPDVLDRIPISETITVAELYVPKSFVNSSLGTLDLRKKMNLSVVAIRRNKVSVDAEGNPLVQEDLVFPEAEEVFREDDILLVVGHNTDIDAFRAY